MIQSGASQNRHTLPRWNRIKTAEQLGEFNSVKKLSLPKDIGSDSLPELLEQWKTEKNLPLAIEIISASKFSKHDENISAILEYAKTATSNISDAPPLLKEFLFETENDTTIASTHQECIEKIKKSLSDFPRNPLLWSELSREYTIMGQRQKSERAIQVAFNLAPENRIILRAIAQFYAHFGDFDQALFFLRKSPLVRVDPWILSSEIALSNEVGRTSKNIKIGQKMILDKNFHPLALSELSSELGTMDFVSGNSKQGKRKFELATIVPYENAVAQIVWVNKNSYNVDSIIKNIPHTNCNFEAEARWHFYNGEWKAAFDLAGMWQEYQPFSREPAMISSFIAADFLMDYRSAEISLQCGLKSNPFDLGLLNNYIYVLTLSGKLDEASDAMNRANKLCPDNNNIPLIATEGLLSYRRGDATTGKTKYLSALEMAKKEKDLDLYYRALLCLAREEKRIGHPISELIQQIEDQKYSFYRKQYNTVINNFQLT